jgi:hypothetical protein
MTRISSTASEGEADARITETPVDLQRPRLGRSLVRSRLGIDGMQSIRDDHKAPFSRFVNVASTLSAPLTRKQ